MTVPTAIVEENVERIPLIAHFVGGISLTIYFGGCRISCASCPWEANTSIRSTDVLFIDERSLARIAARCRPDIIFLHSGLHIPLLFRIARNVAVKVDSALGIRILGRYIDSCSEILHDPRLLILVEIRDLEDLNALESMISDIDVSRLEIVVVSEALTELQHLVDILIRLHLPRFTPISIVCLCEANAFSLLRIIDKLRRCYPLASAPYEPSTELSSTLCPWCNMYIVIRSDCCVIRYRMDSEGRCSYCGRKVFNYVSKRVVKVPVRNVVA